MNINAQTQIQRAVELLGGQRSARLKIGVSQATVSNWVRGMHGVSPKQAKTIEAATSGAVTRYELCPDVFGPAPATSEAA